MQMCFVLFVSAVITPHVLSQCTECKPVIEYCDRHQADDRGRCESCARLCYPGQGNDRICKVQCPDFNQSGAAAYVEPGTTALNLSRSNVQAVAAISKTLTDMEREAEHNRNSSLHRDQAVQAISNNSTVVGIVCGLLSAGTPLIVALAVCFKSRCTRPKKQNVVKDREMEEQRNPINAEEEKSRGQPTECYTGQQSTVHPTGVADDLHPDQKETHQRPQTRGPRANEVVPSGRTWNA